MFERCLVPIIMGNYLNLIWYDFYPVDVVHDFDFTHFVKENTYRLKYNGKSILLKPSKPIKNDSSHGLRH